MSSFTTPLIVSPLKDGKHWRLVEPFSYDVGKEGSGDTITVPVDFVTDFASSPPAIYWLIPEKAEQVFTSMKKWLIHHRALVLFLILVVFGIWWIIQGVLMMRK